MRAERRVRAEFWAQYGRRGPERTVGDRAYLAYLLILTFAVVGGPLGYTLVLGLREPVAVRALTSDAAASVAPAALGALTAAALILGSLRGPALLPPFLAATLAGNGLPRRATLRRPFVRAAALLVLLLVLPAALPVTALVLAGATTPAGAVPPLAATVLFALLLAFAWLCGQVVVGARAWLLPTAVLVLVLLGGLVPPVAGVLPWGWAAAQWPGGAGATWPALVALAAVVVLAGLAVPRLLDAVAGEHLQEQARRWEFASMAAITGDLGTALGRFRARPSVGRRWRVVRGRSFVTAVACSDALAVLRTPSRAVTGTTVLVLGGWAVAAADAARAVPAVGWALAIGGSLLLHGALGVVTDGVRQAVQALLVPRVFGVDDTRLVLAHALAPAVLGGLAAACGAVLALIATGGSGLGPFWVLVLVLVLVVVRVYDAAKGPPPPALSMPIITPMGDVSVLRLLVWQSDAVLFAAAAGTLVHAAGDALAVPVAVAGLVGLVAVLLGVWGSRVREL